MKLHMGSFCRIETGDRYRLFALCYRRLGSFTHYKKSGFFLQQNANHIRQDNIVDFTKFIALIECRFMRRREELIFKNLRRANNTHIYVRIDYPNDFNF